ncbi:fructose 1,6-bisphosphatase [Enterococcus sp. JM4C]|uniref:fructose-1,6-bisphosphatase n=1 Tax=Candidatus Enterococcus huntleyi TaxID=1857217 RepID=UPI00137AA938|nr:fructose-1,6-bisphosphatase [Enterococcus sp. JM4C]KAF1299531.1 fructose 1,6-bisphosphatase [Enterococcus sp. JM4C]
MTQKKYFDLLAKEFENSGEIITELINLEAILNLPKGTELYLSDIHGEYPAFDHILRTGAGNLRGKISECFGDTLSETEKDAFSLLVAYPKEILKDPNFFPEKNHQWYEKTILKLIRLLTYAASKYTRSKVRKALPKNYTYIVEELLYTDISLNEKETYYQEILTRLIELGEAPAFIVEVSTSIQRLVLDHLHIVGDLFDRGPNADKIMDRLMSYHSLDIQWGNHDILWLGAHAGSEACLLTLLRIAARYNYLYELESAYSLNLRPLFLFAEDTYQKNAGFAPKARKEGKAFQPESDERLEKVHQALTILQFKLEGQIIQRRPEFQMADRLLLDKIDLETNQLQLTDQSHPLIHACFQTVSADQPYQLSEEEKYVVQSLMHSFQHSEKLQRHMKFLLAKGSMYLVYNNHLLYHGCIPLNEDGRFMELKIDGVFYFGKSLLEEFEKKIRQSSLSPAVHDDLATDLIWYSWVGKASPLFGRSAMTTFERYFIEDKQTHKEISNPYYQLRNTEKTCQMILTHFGLDSLDSKIINGHTPVKVTKGESPIKASGKLFVIDGGLSKAYQETTGIAGYSLLNNSFGFQIVTHQPFHSIPQLLEERRDRTYLKKVIDAKVKRTLIKETTIGASIQEQCQVLTELLSYLKEKNR